MKATYHLFNVIGAILLVAAVICAVTKQNWMLSLGTLMGGLLAWLKCEFMLLAVDKHYLQQKRALKRGGAWFGE